MHRIDTSTAQKDKFGAGKNGFTRGNPQTGTPATDLDDDYFDMLQEELAGVVEAAGLTLDKSKHNQLITAIHSLNRNRGVSVTSSTTVTIPSWVTEFYVTAAAGGGGGGGAGGSVNLTGVGGGGGGGAAGEFIVRKKFTKLAGVTLDIPVTIGAGGDISTVGTPSANGGNGGDGGSTIIGTLQTLRGGGGGKGGDSFGGTLVPGGGVGGIGYPSGQDGQDGASGSIAGGSGGSGSNSCFGGAGGGSRAGSGGVNGKQAYGYGSGGGGGGAGYGGSGGGANGGYGAAGSQGIAIFEW